MAQTFPKKVIAAGPGNPPVLVDETADLSLAAKEISVSASFDNNILCIAEKEIIVVDSVFESFMRAMESEGCVRLSERQMDEMANKALEKSGKHWITKRDFVGKTASVLGRALNLNVSENCPLIIGETKADHPWVVAEQMTCCIPVVRVRDFEEGIKVAQHAEHRFRHTSSVFTKDINRATRYTRVMDCTVNVINGGTLRGNGGDLGEAYFSHTIATPTGEGITKPLDFVRKRRVMTHPALRFV
jgi:acyl-CoA reductase-like NAD-dependent aldehyde dehydrogenase